MMVCIKDMSMKRNIKEIRRFASSGPVHSWPQLTRQARLDSTWPVRHASLRCTGHILLLRHDHKD